MKNFSLLFWHRRLCATMIEVEDAAVKRSWECGWFVVISNCRVEGGFGVGQVKELRTRALPLNLRPFSEVWRVRRGLLLVSRNPLRVVLCRGTWHKVAWIWTKMCHLYAISSIPSLIQQQPENCIFSVLGLNIYLTGISILSSLKLELLCKTSAIH